MIFDIKRFFKNHLWGIISLGMYNSAHTQGHYGITSTLPSQSIQTYNGGQEIHETSDLLHERGPQLIKLVDLMKEISFLLEVQFIKDPNSFLNSMIYKDGERNLQFEFTNPSHHPSVSLFKDSRHFIHQIYQRLHRIIHIDCVNLEHQKYLAIKFHELYELLMKMESPPPEKRNPSQADSKLREIFMLFSDLSVHIQNHEDPSSYRDLIVQFIEEKQHLIESFHQEFFLGLFKS